MVDMFTGPVNPVQAAQAAIRAFCGWHVAPVLKETLVLDGTGTDTLLLPTMRIVNLLSVKVNGRNVTDQVRWSEAGMLENVWFPKQFRAVEVTLQHGFDPTALTDVAGVIERAAKRFATDPTIRSQSVGGASVTYGGTASGGLSHLLTLDEQAALAPYRLTWGC